MCVSSRHSSEVLSPPTRGVTAGDVERAADSLLRAGERPTIDRVRQKLGKGSPNTINPLLDAWWKKLSTRLDADPAAFHRLPESVAHVAEALWMHALDEGRRRAQLELKSKDRTAAEQQQTLEIRSHVLSLREGELDSRLRDRETTIADLQRQLRELTLILRKDQVTREMQNRRIATLENELLARHQPPKKPPRARRPPTPKRKPAASGAGPLRRSGTATARKKTAKRRSPSKRRRR